MDRRKNSGGMNNGQCGFGFGYSNGVSFGAGAYQPQKKSFKDGIGTLSTLEVAGLALVVVLIIVLLGYGSTNYTKLTLSNELKGKNVVIHTYDEDSNVIDTIVGTSVSIKGDDKFKFFDDEGKAREKIWCT